MVVKYTILIIILFSFSLILFPTFYFVFTEQYFSIKRMYSIKSSVIQKFSFFSCCTLWPQRGDGGNWDVRAKHSWYITVQAYMVQNLVETKQWRSLRYHRYGNWISKLEIITLGSAANLKAIADCVKSSMPLPTYDISPPSSNKCLRWDSFMKPSGAWFTVAMSHFRHLARKWLGHLMNLHPELQAKEALGEYARKVEGCKEDKNQPEPYDKINWSEILQDISKGIWFTEPDWVTYGPERALDERCSSRSVFIFALSSGSVISLLLSNQNGV